MDTPLKPYPLNTYGALVLWSSGFFLLFFIFLAAFQKQTLNTFAVHLKEEFSQTPDEWPPVLLAFYAARNFQPLWIRSGKLTPVAVDLLDVLDHAPDEGLRREDYINAAILRELARINNAPPHMGSAASMQLELKLSMALLRYASDLKYGSILPEQLHPYWKPAQRDPGFALIMDDLEKMPLRTVLDQLLPRHEAYFKLRDALAAYRTIAGQGGWPQINTGPALKSGDTDKRVPGLWNRLNITGDLPPSSADSSQIFDKTLEDGVKHFQLRHGLAATGIVDNRTLQALNVPVEDRIAQLSLNINRWRWMPASFPPRNIQINIPDYTLEAFADGARALSMKVIVGKTATPTEVFYAELSHVVLSPFWYVPASIAQNEVLPLLKKDASYLEKNHIEVRFQGRTIDADTIAWGALSNNDFPYILRQKPGPSNALGQIRFTLPNVLNIGLHDTPERSLFNRQDRAFSHGCIRLENPVGLALYALNDTSWTEKRLNEIIGYNIEHHLKVSAPIPVYILYVTARVDDHGLVHFRDDVYGFDHTFKSTLALHTASRSTDCIN